MDDAVHIMKVQCPSFLAAMSPAFVLRSTFAAPSATSSPAEQPQSTGASINTAAAGFIAPLAIFTGLLILLILSFMYQIMKPIRHSVGEREPTDSPADGVAAFRANRMRVRAARKDEIGREVDAEPFSQWRAKQLERMKSPAAFPTQVVCTVCLNELTNEDLVRDLACRHAYHVDCLDEWYSRGHNQCPMCKGELCDAHNHKTGKGTPQ